MQDKNCLEALKVLKLEHQEWFNDIAKRLNTLLIDKKKVKFESISKVASKWIIPVDSHLKKLDGIQDIQKLILVEVQEYQKIFNLINKPLNASLFESKARLFKKRDDKIVFHSDVLSNIYKQIVTNFNNLEKDLILEKKKCVALDATSTIKSDVYQPEEDLSGFENVVNKEVNPQSEVVLSNNVLEKEEIEIPKEQNTVADVKAKIERIRAEAKEKAATKVQDNAAKKDVVQEEEQGMETTTIDNSSMMLNNDLINSLAKNRASKKEQKIDATSEFNLEEEIKKIIG